MMILMSWLFTVAIVFILLFLPMVLVIAAVAGIAYTILNMFEGDN